MGFCRALAIVDDRDCSDSEVANPSGRRKTGTGGDDGEETAQKKTDARAQATTYRALQMDSKSRQKQMYGEWRDAFLPSR